MLQLFQKNLIWKAIPSLFNFPTATVSFLLNYLEEHIYASRATQSPNFHRYFIAFVGNRRTQENYNY